MPAKGRVIAIVQPHRYHAPARPVRRFRRLLQRCRHGVHRAGLCGGRRPDRRRQLGSAGRAASAPAATATRATSPAPPAIAPIVARARQPGDFVVFLGAGNITQWAYALPKELAALRDEACMISGDGSFSPRLGDRLDGRSRPHHARCGDGQDHLVPRRRPGRGAVPAGRRGRSRGLPARRCRRMCR